MKLKISASAIKNICSLATRKKTVLWGIAASIFSFSLVNGEISPDYFSKELGNIRNIYGGRIETAIFNPAVLGSQPNDLRCIRFIPLNSYTFGYWSDKLALTPYKEYFSITDDGQWQAIVNQLIVSSFRIAGDTPENASKKITKKIKDGVSVYTGLDIKLMGATIGNIAFDIGTSAHIETHLPAAPFLIVFSENKGLRNSSNLSLTDLEVQARVTTDINVAYGEHLYLSEPMDFLNNFTRNITDFKESSWGVGLTVSLGHGYVDLKTVDGGITYSDNGTSLVADAKVKLRTSGTGVCGNWDFFNPYENGFNLAGFGAGINAGVLMRGEKTLISAAIQRLGPMIWNNIQECEFDIRTRELSLSTFEEEGVDIFDPENGGVSPEDVILTAADAHLGWMPTRFNLGLVYRFDFEKIEKQKLRALSEYTNTFFGYEQSLAPWPGRSFVPRITLGAENGFLWGYFPVRAGFVFGGSERIASTAGFTLGLPAFNLQFAYKAIGTPFWFPRKGMELGLNLSTEWKRRVKRTLTPTDGL